MTLFFPRKISRIMSVLLIDWLIMFYFNLSKACCSKLIAFSYLSPLSLSLSPSSLSPPPSLSLPIFFHLVDVLICANFHFFKVLWTYKKKGKYFCDKMTENKSGQIFFFCVPLKNKKKKKCIQIIERLKRDHMIFQTDFRENFPSRKSLRSICWWK